MQKGKIRVSIELLNDFTGGAPLSKKMTCEFLERNLIFLGDVNILKILDDEVHSHRCIGLIIEGEGLPTSEENIPDLECIIHKKEGKPPFVTYKLIENKRR
jgi:hypothetical protein